MVLFEFSNLADTGFYLEALGIRQAHLPCFTLSRAPAKSTSVNAVF